MLKWMPAYERTSDIGVVCRSDGRFPGCLHDEVHTSKQNAHEYTDYEIPSPHDNNDCNNLGQLANRKINFDKVLLLDIPACGLSARCRVMPPSSTRTQA